MHEHARKLAAAHDAERRAGGDERGRHFSDPWRQAPSATHETLL
jgi:hypothetical protein